MGKRQLRVRAQAQAQAGVQVHDSMAWQAADAWELAEGAQTLGPQRA